MRMLELRPNILAREEPGQMCPNTFAAPAEPSLRVAEPDGDDQDALRTTRLDGSHGMHQCGGGACASHLDPGTELEIAEIQTGGDVLNPASVAGDDDAVHGAGKYPSVSAREKRCLQ
jgi:hypothetical protein